MNGVWLRLLRLLGWSRSQREIDDELRFHVEMETEALKKSGLGAREARRPRERSGIAYRQCDKTESADVVRITDLDEEREESRGPGGQLKTNPGHHGSAAPEKEAQGDLTLHSSRGEDGSHSPSHGSKVASSPGTTRRVCQYTGSTNSTANKKNS